MSAPTDLGAQRAILCHFDSYSTALVFARWPDRSLLWPGPLPAGAQALDDGPPADGEAMRQAVLAQFNIPPDDLVWMPGFDECVQADGQVLRVQLLRFETFEAPGALIAPAGGEFKPLVALRGHDPLELGLLREVFNLIVGGSGRAARA